MKMNVTSISAQGCVSEEQQAAQDKLGRLLPDNLFACLVYPEIPGERSPMEIDKGMVYVSLDVDPEIKDAEGLLANYHYQLEEQLAAYVCSLQEKYEIKLLDTHLRRKVNTLLEEYAEDINSSKEETLGIVCRKLLLAEDKADISFQVYSLKLDGDNISIRSNIYPGVPFRASRRELLEVLLSLQMEAGASG